MTTVSRTRARRSPLSNVRAGLENLESRMLLSGVTGYAFDSVAAPNGITHDNAGNLYVTDFQGTIDKISTDANGNPTSAVSFDAAGASGGYIVFNPANSHLYFTDGIGNIDEMDTDGNLVNSFAIPNANNNSPETFTVTSDGAIWFAAGPNPDSTDGFQGSVVRMDINGSFTEQNIILHNAMPFSIAAASDGSIWLGIEGGHGSGSGNGDSSLVHATFSGSSISYTDYAIPQPQGVVSGLTVAGDGSVWYVNQNVSDAPGTTDQIGHAVLTGGSLSTTIYTIPEATSGTTNPAAPQLDSSGRLWFAEAGHLSNLNTTTGQFTRLATNDDGAISLDLTLTGQGVYMATLNGAFSIEAVSLSTYTAPVASSSPTITASTGVPFSGTVATFTSSAAGTFTYSLDYGDGNVDTGSIASNSSGSYSVSGSQTYSATGSYPLTLTVTDPSGDVLTFKGSATVTPAVTSTPLVAQGINVSGQEQGPLAANVSGVSTLVVANFSGPAATYTATINWGDSTTSAGTVVATSSGYYVKLPTGVTKTYAQQGHYTITVSITDGTHSTTATSTATISDIPLVATPITPVTPVLGSIALATVATFTDDLSSTASWFKSTITWGDGTTSTGLVVRTSAGHYSVVGLHLYTHKGTFTISVLINNLVENVSATVTDTITIKRVL